jgi:myo-inositol-1(or 4)-monophosphatase
MNFEIILEQTINTAKKAGKFIKQEQKNLIYNQVEIKGLNDLVSYVDKTSEKMIVEELNKIMPEAGFLVEENSISESKNYNWIVDPLDGTTNYVHGIPCYSVSIGLECKGEMILGVVYEINRDECFYASKGKGSFLNGEKIQVSDRKNLSESLIATGFPINNFSRLKNYLEVLEYLIKNTHGVRRIGSAATDLCYLACGRVDAFFEYNLNAWDIAAGAIIVKEAGGSIYDFSGGKNWLYGKEISCSNRLLKEEFNLVIKKYFKI